MNSIHFLIISFCLAAFVSCDTSPATEQDDYSENGIEESPEEYVSEQLEADELDDMEDTNVVKAELSGKGDTDMSGNVFISSPHDKGLILTVVLDGLEPDNYNVYLTKKNDCNDLDGLTPGEMTEEEIISEVEVIADGTGRNESELYGDMEKDDYSGRAVVIFNDEGEIVGCGVFKSSAN